MIGYATLFDRVRIRKCYPGVLTSSEDVIERLVEGVGDLNIDRVENEERSLRVVIYLPMSGTNSRDPSLLKRTEIL